MHNGVGARYRGSESRAPYRVGISKIFEGAKGTEEPTEGGTREPPGAPTAIFAVCEMQSAPPSKRRVGRVASRLRKIRLKQAV